MGLNLYARTRDAGGTGNLPDGKLTQNPAGDLRMALAMLERGETVRMGASWHASIPTGSAFTTVAAWPTTRAELVLSNTAPAGPNSPSLVIDRIWAATIVTETAASALTILCQISPASAVAVVTDNTVVLQRRLDGKGSLTGRSANAALALANTAFAVASQWDVPDQAEAGTNLAAVSLGQASVARINGGYIISPQATFCMNAVVGTAVAAAGIMGVVWHEVVLGS